MSNSEIRTLGDRVNFAPNDKDEKKIVWLCNNNGMGISDAIRKAIHFYYFAIKSGKYNKFMDELMEDYE